MTLTGILFGITVLLILFGILEAALHRRALARIPVRIHVNGTRGKSSVTRLIAAGLRGRGLSVCAKTTGSEAVLIGPDGAERRIERISRPNIIEQIRVVRWAAACRAEVLVIECMAVQPFLQWLSESKLVRATHAVITNVRPDHLDLMGPEVRDAAAAMAATVPVQGTLLTAATEHLDVLESACRDRRTRLVVVEAVEASQVTSRELSAFSYIEHAENVALALRVCQEFGVKREEALARMPSVRPDAGALTIAELDFHGGRHIVFVNGFAANDPESTGRIWDIANARFPGSEKRIALVNCRADRADRSRRLAEACVGRSSADHYLLTGEGTAAFAHAAVDHGLDPFKLIQAEGRPAAEIFEAVIGLSGRETLVVGIGNIGGAGLDLVHYFRNRGKLSEAA